MRPPKTTASRPPLHHAREPSEHRPSPPPELHAVTVSPQPPMGDFTHFEYAEFNSTRLFAPQLAHLAKELYLPLPMFMGRKLVNSIPGVNRWEIQSVLLGDPTDPTSENMSYSGIYPDWSIGVDMAMHAALSRMCHRYHDKLPPNSDFLHFGRRNEEGVAMVTPGDKWNMPDIAKKIEDMECYTVHMEEKLNNLMMKNDQAKALIHAQKAKIAALLAQINPPSPSDESDDDDDGGDEGCAANA